MRGISQNSIYLLVFQLSVTNHKPVVVITSGDINN